MSASTSLYGEWCPALSAERAELERARDARMGRLSDTEALSSFNQALARLESAEREHRAMSGCTARH